MMRTHMPLQSKGASRAKPQQVVYELKRRVVLALNKLTDRDTCRIGVDELDKIVQGLAPEGVSPFLSCILDIDSEQKTTLRKECIRLMGLLVTVHETPTLPHLERMVSSIVKRLKDSDSVVRDACVETLGVFASKLGNQQSESNRTLVALVKPFFEALGEQNKQVQSGAALCLAGAIDNMEAPPASVLDRMLARTIKLLKSPHFMAKPALIELNRSLIQAGGAPSSSSLSAAVSGIREALQSSDWMTRKAAAVALDKIGSNGGSFLAHCKASCVNSLEACRFDKVKPVRDAVSQALHCWRTAPDPDIPEPSETGCFTKENSCGGDYSDLAGVGSSISEVSVHKEPGASLDKKNRHLSIRKTSKTSAVKSNRFKMNNWHKELNVSKTSSHISDDCHFEESEGSSATEVDTVASNNTNIHKTGYGYPLVDDKKEDSYASYHILDNYANSITVPHFCSDRDDEMNHPGKNCQFATERHECETKSYSSKMRERTSLASTITDFDNSQTLHAYCPQTEKDIVRIQKQLLEIEERQSCLMDLLQVLTTRTMECLSNIQSKVSGLEQAVDSIAHDLCGGTSTDLSHLKLVKSQLTPSPRLVDCTPRSSIGTYDGHSSVACPRSSKVWEEKVSANGRDVNQAKDSDRSYACDSSRNLRRKKNERSSRHEKQSPSSSQNGKRGQFLASASDHSIKPSGLTSSTGVWQCIHDFQDDRDLDLVYKEALGVREGILLIELLDRTGPVLEFLSKKTTNDLLITLASYLSEQRFMNTIFPWLQQVVELSVVHGSNYIPLSSKAKREILVAVQETMKAEASHPAGRSLVQKLAAQLQELWGKVPL
ncbi:hypothetical protein Dimus_010861 [Dionaea muscipula]